MWECACVYFTLIEFFVWFFFSSSSSLVTPHLFRSLCLAVSLSLSPVSLCRVGYKVLIGLRAISHIQIMNVCLCINSRSSWTRSSVYSCWIQRKRKKYRPKYINKYFFLIVNHICVCTHAYHDELCMPTIYPVKTIINRFIASHFNMIISICLIWFQNGKQCKQTQAATANKKNQA